MKEKGRFKVGELALYSSHYIYNPNKDIVEVQKTNKTYSLILSNSIPMYKNKPSIDYYYCLLDTGRIDKVLVIDLEKI